MKTTSDKFVHLANLPAIAALTAYDFPTAKLIDEAGVDLILVGDSLGMVVAGLENTTGVTMDHMLYHTEMVARAV
ncbi:MAG: 3-methyl-2-oxobutanoate hydroxymethyltransferase, partial [Verrucomicrobiota bacterium]